MNKTTFPDLRGMTDHAHSVGLKVGWYGSNCHCQEQMSVPSWGANVSHGQSDGVNHYVGDVQAIVDFGFTAIKLDNCGEFHNMTLFAEL